MNVYEKLAIVIEEQQKGHENEPLFMVGEQLKDIARDNLEAAQIILDDIQVDGMKLEDAEEQIHNYANKNHGKAKSFCVSPKVAEEILRDFYKIPKGNTTPKEETKELDFDLSSFL